MKKWEAVLIARVLDPVALRQQKARGRQIPADGSREVITFKARTDFEAGIKALGAAKLRSMDFPKKSIAYRVDPDSIRPCS